MRTVQRIPKELDESNGYYEGLETHFDHSYKKRTPKFVGENQTIIDSYYNTSIRSGAWVMGVSEFLIRLLVQEDIWYFS